MTINNLDNKESNGVKRTRNSRIKPEYTLDAPSTEFVIVDLTNDIIEMLHEDSWRINMIQDNDNEFTIRLMRSSG